MSISLADNRSQPVLGAFIIFLYALYGAYIDLLYILQGGKGNLRSEFFLLFVIVFLLFFLGNLSKLLIIKTVKINARLMLLLFILYFLLNFLFTDSEKFSYYLGSIIDMATKFIAGFIAFSTLGSRIPIISKIITNLHSVKKMRGLAIISALIFIGLMLYFLSESLNTSLFNVFQIIVVTNDYYQDFGDSITIAYCCLVTVQISYFVNNIYSDRKFFIFSIILSLEAAIAFICLQVLNSNKSVLVIILVSVLSILFCKPQKWLISRGKIKLKSFLLIFIIFIVCFLSFLVLPPIDVSQMRIFDGSSILTNSSVQSRQQIINDYFMKQLLNAPIFGDMSIKYYMHSSLLSVQTHLGIIGSLLLWPFIIIQLYHIYRNRGNESLKAIAPSIIFVSIISSFFTWGPLWFLIGALYAYTPEPQRHSSLPNNLHKYKKI